jgi:hypothetical protein
MVDQPRSSQPTPPPRPKWVKVSIIVAVVIVGVVVVMAIAGGEHSPSRHLSGGGNPGGHSPPVEHSP